MGCFFFGRCRLIKDSGRGGGVEKEENVGEVKKDWKDMSMWQVYLTVWEKIKSYEMCC